MSVPIDQFDENIAWTRDLLALGQAVDASTTLVVDVGDIQRAAMVMAVSALDHYVHEKTRVGMREVLEGARQKTDAFLKFSIPMRLTLDARSDPARDDWIEDAVQLAHGHLPFQKADVIADAIRLISDAKLWEEVAGQLGAADAKVVKANLAVITDRRNKIAHEADRDPTQPGRRWPISHGLVSDAIEFIEKVVHAIEARC